MPYIYAESTWIWPDKCYFIDGGGTAGKQLRMKHVVTPYRSLQFMALLNAELLWPKVNIDLFPNDTNNEYQTLQFSGDDEYHSDDYNPEEDEYDKDNVDDILQEIENGRPVSNFFESADGGDTNVDLL
ncbi:hypothetical protein BDA99DRAFT_541818 [Phascolomyces articulosus]|uniref:Uncharacterized protein n=1 Tax=Phascolomyces articulosus TaxID=60185 RepID=A0AAD5K285_9FUNG|nr:hypothetical protein BDA99DRAFT_541818 [Phascolomyces articulosus]